MSWNFHKFLGKLTKRYNSIKTESGLVLQESVVFIDRRFNKGVSQ